MPEKDKKKRKELLNKIKKWGFIILMMIFLIKINKVFFFLGIFTALTFAGKMVRGQLGLSMVVLDPLLFFAVLIVKFMGIKILVVFLFFVVFFADIVSGIFSPGSFLNYVLYHLCPILGVIVFGSFTDNMLIYGNIASLIYSVLYVLGRTFIIPDDPIQVYAKAITSFVFTFLYITFLGPILGPIFQILMSN